MSLQQRESAHGAAVRKSSVVLHTASARFDGNLQPSVVRFGELHGERWRRHLPHRARPRVLVHHVLVFERLWWQSLVPAKTQRATPGKDAERYRPRAEHPLCAELKKRSKGIADASKNDLIAPDQVAELRDIARAR